MTKTEAAILIDNIISDINTLSGMVHNKNIPSTIRGIEAALAGKTALQLHDNWCEERRKEGWVYGKVKDLKAKTHPCLVSYGGLSPINKIKDFVLFHISKKVKNDWEEFQKFCKRKGLQEIAEFPSSTISMAEKEFEKFCKEKSNDQHD